MLSRRGLRLAALGLAIAVGGVAGAPAWQSGAHAQTAAPADAARVAVFDEVWRTVRDRFYDPAMNGRDWPAIGDRYRPLYAAANDAAARAAIVNAMLAELGASHTSYFVPGDPAYYQLADVFFSRGRRDNLRRVFPNGEISYPGIGIFTTTESDGRIFVTGVIEGAAAARAGVLTGDEILSVENEPFAPVGSFQGRVGFPTSLMIRRVEYGPAIEIKVVPETIKPGEMFLRSVEASARIIPAAGGLRIGYVRLWSYANPAYQQALERLVSEGALKDADALVWDLRDGWGGAEVSYLDLFNRHAPELRTAGRNGTVVARDPRWRKPVAMLINGGSRSGKEILAYGFKKYGMGELIGTTTAKDVLAATGFFMSDGSLLEVAVNDVWVDGDRIEGVGVDPTITVPFDRAYAAGRDPQLDRAIEVLSRARMN
jgi:carboxyl-terminal processing protease